MVLLSKSCSKSVSLALAENMFPHILASIIYVRSINFLISFSGFVSNDFIREHLSLSFLKKKNQKTHSFELFMSVLFLHFPKCIRFVF